MSSNPTTSHLKVITTGGTPKARQFLNAMIAGDDAGCARIFDEIMESQPTVSVIEGGKADGQGAMNAPVGKTVSRSDTGVQP